MRLFEALQLALVYSSGPQVVLQGWQSASTVDPQALRSYVTPSLQIEQLRQMVSEEAVHAWKEYSPLLHV